MPHPSVPGRHIEIFFNDANRTIDVECEDQDRRTFSIATLSLTTSPEPTWRTSSVTITMWPSALACAWMSCGASARSRDRFAIDDPAFRARDAARPRRICPRTELVTLACAAVFGIRAAPTAAMRPRTLQRDHPDLLTRPSSLIAGRCAVSADRYLGSGPRTLDPNSAVSLSGPTGDRTTGHDARLKRPVAVCG
jgi:hypothetical protein